MKLCFCLKVVWIVSKGVFFGGEFRIKKFINNGVCYIVYKIGFEEKVVVCESLWR